MIDLILSTEQEQLLRDQPIDADRPGSILHDFEALLAFVGADGVKAAGKYNLLPISAIATLDERLARPLRLQLQRPQLRSHPYLQGLHLLLRASCLGRIQGTGDKARLSVDPDVLAVWRSLNATEQYFTLLEAWLRFGRAEMIGEHDRTWGSSLLLNCIGAWRDLSARGQRFDLKKPGYFFMMGIGQDLYMLALIDLFGLMKVEHSPTPVQPWRPARISHQPFGDALFTQLAKAKFSEFDEPEEDPADALRFGKWQPLLQPYFPAWRNNLELPQAEPRTGTYVFKVTLGNAWRRIAIGADATLDELANAIVHSVDFDFDHLYEFVYRDRTGAKVTTAHPECDEEGPFTDEVQVGTLPLEPGQSMEFTYDFGDSWKFGVKLEGIEPANKGPKQPKVLERHGNAPEQYPTWD